MDNKWYKLEYERLEWKSRFDFQYLSRQEKSKISSTYDSSIPDTISDKSISLSNEIDGKISDLLVNLARFDMEQSQKGYSFPTMLLRSESAASSQIENLTSSIRNISMAELSDKVPKNAKIIIGNVNAMRNALSISEPLSIESIKEIHRALMKDTKKQIAGNFRETAVWIGGTNFSPHQAVFVPPHYSRINALMTDLVEFSKRFDLNPIIKAAILHAQFETIHPFVDGNGRTGRALIHKSLKDDGVLNHASLPISAGLLNKTKEYMDSLKAFQEGNPLPIIEELVNAVEISLVIGNIVSKEISIIIEEWESKIDERKTSSIYKLIYLLIEQPVINSLYLSDKLNITIRAANQLIERAIDYGILSKFGSAQRGIFYQANDIIDIMNMIPDNEIIRRYF